MYNSHYSNPFVKEASENPEHLLWSAHPEHDSRLIDDERVDDECADFYDDKELVRDIFWDHFKHLDYPTNMFVCFNNLDENTITNYTNRDPLDKSMTEEDFWEIEIDEA